MATLQTTKEQIIDDISLTTPFLTTLRECASGDADFRVSLLEYAADSMLAGDLDETKAVLRAYIKATTGYRAFAEDIGIHPKSLVRMLGPNGNPRAANLLSILSKSLASESLKIDVTATVNSASVVTD